jgi:hypothetical protein
MNSLFDKNTQRSARLKKRNYIPTDEELLVFDNKEVVGIHIRKSECCKGDGAFATKRMKPHTLLGQYKGLFIDNSEVESSDSAYLMNYGNGIFVDARDPEFSSWHRYMNSPYRTNKTANVRLTLGGLMYTIKKIKVDEELLWNYGTQYQM